MTPWLGFHKERKRGIFSFPTNLKSATERSQRRRRMADPSIVRINLALSRQLYFSEQRVCIAQLKTPPQTWSQLRLQLIPSRREATCTPNSGVCVRRRQNKTKHESIILTFKAPLFSLIHLSFFWLTSTINRRVRCIHDYDSAQAFPSCFVEYKFADPNKLFLLFSSHSQKVFPSPEVGFAFTLQQT